MNVKIKVKVKAFATLRNILGKERVVELDEGGRVQELLEKLSATNEELYKLLFDADGLKDEMNILVNGKNMTTLNGIQTKLENGDEVALFPAAIGG
jgi:sulfur-carrier protein